MPFLLSLSEELLVRIVDFVSTDHASLTQLALVSKIWNRLTTPRLYAIIDFKGATMDTGVTCLIPLTFQLLRNPDLAALVRSFSIRDNLGTLDNGLVALEDAEGDDEARRGWPDHPALESIIKKAVETVEDGEEEKEKLFKIVHEGSDEEAILAILLPTLINLRKLDIVYAWLEPRSYLMRLLGKITKREGPFKEKPAFTNLTDVLISGCDEKEPNEPNWIGAYLELPSIRRLHGYQLGRNEQDSTSEMMTKLGISTSLVEEIELRQSQLYAEDLDQILKACKNLKTFIYEVGHAWAWYPLRTQDIMHSLQPVAETLENLVLVHPDYFEEGPGDEILPVSLGGFSKLQFLKIALVFLGGFDNSTKLDLTGTFPKTLERLHVTHVGDDGNPTITLLALLKVIQQNKSLLPELKNLVLEGSFVEYPNHLDDVKELIQIARANGITTVLLTDEDVDGRPWDKRVERGWGLDGEIEWKECMNNQVGEVKILDVVGWK